jgi:hypothetical protein
MKKRITITILAIVLLASVPAMADLITVQGTSSIYLADQLLSVGAPFPFAPGNYFGDLTDADTRPAILDITGFVGGPIDISAAGSWTHTDDPGQVTDPAGYGFTDTEAAYRAFGISSINNGPLNALIGVFLTAAAPIPASLPGNLDHNTDVMTAPLLQQSFVIGASLENIMIPFGATRLVLGLNNGFEWTNNLGSVDVTVVPVPGACLLGSLGLGFATWRLKRRKMA